MFTMQASFINTKDSYLHHSKDSMWVDFSAVENKVLFCNRHYIKPLASPGLFTNVSAKRKLDIKIKKLNLF